MQSAPHWPSGLDLDCTPTTTGHQPPATNNQQPTGNWQLATAGLNDKVFASQGGKNYVGLDNLYASSV